MRATSRLFNMTAAMSIAVAALVTSCSDDMSEIAAEKEGTTSARTSATVFVGTTGGDNTITSDRTWTSNNEYIIRGIVRIGAGATLTIEPGTIIKGEFNGGSTGRKGTLVVERDGNIIANGTASSPIIFTSQQAVGSRRPGDWGGVIILGNAVNNQGTNVQIEGVSSSTTGAGRYGGTDDNDNSGSLRYVRIEYPGTQLGEGNEINGLTLGSVGRGTTIDHVQVLYTQDDGFEWFGGTVDARYLYAYGVSDDDFDTDFGFRGRIQFAAGVKTTSSEPSDGASNGFESDNDAAGSGNTPQTNAVFANVTLSGPVGADPAVFNVGQLIRRNSAQDLYNSIISEWDEAQNLGSSDQAASTNTRISHDGAPGVSPEGLSFLADVLPNDENRTSGSAPNLTRSPNLGSTVDPDGSGSFFSNTGFRGAFSSTRSQNDGWDLASENAAFDWLSFKSFGR